jgi:hypothetical protein
MHHYIILFIKNVRRVITRRTFQYFIPWGDSKLLRYYGILDKKDERCYTCIMKNQIVEASQLRLVLNKKGGIQWIPRERLRCCERS